jgi:hypothetical protein
MSVCRAPGSDDPHSQLDLALIEDQASLTRQSRKRNSEANMAFVRQNGWCLNQPIWGECHAFSMVVFGQVFQPHCLRFALL